ncbi:hypothetical protein EFA69_14535 [Rufibacter immobilis]|uniref:Uncharacterized protein n=1 Tax=Rufibacter immobilis TaxID=1348778 RepID=A0A3M9MQ59_9BACT|nr:hypothetical protein [Rufibacter immobilis]RNI27355.1 hypothetical protein EFA69_14535 [Rufibacter immobilis]
MEKNTKKSGELSEEEFLADMKKLSDRAKEVTGVQTGLFDGADLGEEDLDTSFDIANLNDTADPDASHKLYYTMMAVLRRHLPSGKENEKLRRYIYDEKSLFLNRGKAKDEKGVRGSDERMAYLGNFLNVALNTVQRWVEQGAVPYDLYMAFNTLNRERGYHSTENQKEGSTEVEANFE